MEGESRAVRIPSGAVVLDADFVPSGTGAGTVVFAHGSGSGRRSPRNRFVAESLRSRGLGTLLLDLLANEEAQRDERTREYRFDIPLLTERLLAASDWLRNQPEARRERLGYFGASTGGAVAMIAAGERAGVVGAIVLRGARTDLGDFAAARIGCPTLILVGERDEIMRRANEVTLSMLRCEKELVVVPRASHLFEESGAIEEVARRSADWFARHLAPRPS